MATAAVSAAVVAAGLAYLDGKYQLRHDWKVLSGRKQMGELFAEAIKRKRVSPYYFIEANAKRDPNKEIIWTRNGCYSWTETYDQANRYAQFFLRNGVEPGQFVALFMANSPDFVFAWIGLWAIGAAPALINHNLTSNALLHCLAVSEAKLVLADGGPELLGRIEDVQDSLSARGTRLIKLAEVRQQIHAMPALRPDDGLREALQPGSPIMLFYTSGTTGMPKACIFPVAAGFMHAVSMICGYSIVRSQDDRYYDCMPLYHGTGGISGMTQLLLGVTLCIAPKFSVSGFWDDVRDSRATWFVYVGETLRYLLSAPPSPQDRDHQVYGIYGNGLRPDVWTAFRDRFGITRIFEFFNSTEGVLSLNNPAQNDFRAHAVGYHGLLQRSKFHDVYVPVAIDPETGDIARDPATGFAMRVDYETGGEILIPHGDPNVPRFTGYHNNEEASLKKFVKNVFKDGDMYYRTGDALRRDREGRWYFMDRLGDTFRWKGENVATTEVAQIVGQHPGVGEAWVYGVSLPGHDGKAGMAAIYLEPTVSQFDYAGLLRHTRRHLPKYAVPVFLRIVTERSTTHNNKQNKMPLKNEGIDPKKVTKDQLLWISDHGKGHTYVPFTSQDWHGLHKGKARL